MSVATNAMWFLMTTNHGITTFKPYRSSHTAIAKMKEEYAKYEFDPSIYKGKGSCRIDGLSAFIDNPTDNVQLHWHVVNVGALRRIWINSPDKP